MKKSAHIIFAAALFAAGGLSVNAQDTEKKEADKTATIDAWREAMPQTEEPAYKMTAEQAASDATPKENEAQLSKRIVRLEGRFIEALKMRDVATLDKLLAVDFVPVGIDLNAQPADKQHFIEWAMKNFQLKNYSIESSSVRIFPDTAIVTLGYKRQAMIGGTAADGSFVLTDVWVKRGNQWQSVSHHISAMPPSAAPVNAMPVSQTPKP